MAKVRVRVRVAHVESAPRPVGESDLLGCATEPGDLHVETDLEVELVVTG